jgi:hypothetical protein
MLDPPFPPVFYFLPVVDRWMGTLVADPLLGSIGQIKTTIRCMVER